MNDAGRARDVMRFGSVEVRRVPEWLGPIGTVDQILPDTPDRLWRENQDWLDPAFVDVGTGSWRAAIQTWVLQDGDLTVLVDTGVGNDRDRPQAPALARLQTNFLDSLRAVGVEPDDVDLVVNTHIHYDHVGWNTTLIDGEWQPTFRNARYLVPARDREYFRPENAQRIRPPQTEDEQRRFEGIRLVYADSIAPIEQSGQMETWDGERRLTDSLQLELAPGHTPGSSVLWLKSGPGAVFVGDLTHSPMQVLRPDDACSFDLDAPLARRSRRSVLATAATRGAVVLPAHYAGHGGFRLAPDGDAYRIIDWASLTQL